eukprot:TRINITY_DN11803_c0_g2_i1.p1 TRINITY_DN11803_c0_g2~~TRINITY_DN11803_c0_g2_i1.p1  ORF type:complete len:359 (+),score=30.85 TRINITY_DN11803_c0_g2_i1:1-1077(+)
MVFPEDEVRRVSVIGEVHDLHGTLYTLVRELKHLRTFMPSGVLVQEIEEQLSSSSSAESNPIPSVSSISRTTFALERRATKMSRTMWSLTSSGATNPCLREIAVLTVRLVESFSWHSLLLDTAGVAVGNIKATFSRFLATFLGVTSGLKATIIKQDFGISELSVAWGYLGVCRFTRVVESAIKIQSCLDDAGFKTVMAITRSLSWGGVLGCTSKKAPSIIHPHGGCVDTLLKTAVHYSCSLVTPGCRGLESFQTQPVDWVDITGVTTCCGKTFPLRDMVLVYHISFNTAREEEWMYQMEELESRKEAITMAYRYYGRHMVAEALKFAHTASSIPGSEIPAARLIKILSPQTKSSVCEN